MIHYLLNEQCSVVIYGSIKLLFHFFKKSIFTTSKFLLVTLNKIMTYKSLKLILILFFGIKIDYR